MVKETRLTENPQSAPDAVSVSKRGSFVKKVLSHTSLIIEVAHPIILGFARNYRQLYFIAVLLGGVKAGLKKAHKDIEEFEKERKEKRNGQD